MGTPPATALDAGQPAAAGFRSVLADLATTIATRIEGTIVDEDPEELHQLRVAVRRSRSVLAEAKGLVPDDGRAHFAGELRWFGEITTDPRDLHVSIDLWPHLVAPLGVDDAGRLEPARAELIARRERAHEALVAALRGDRADRLLREWCAWLHPVAGDADGPLLGPYVAARIDARQRSLVRDGRAITPASPAEHLHDLRKDAKKVRYLVECFGDLFPKKPRKRFVARLQDLQTNLGDHQDAEVELTLLRELAVVLHGSATLGAEGLLALGRLWQLVDERRLTERDRFVETFAAYDDRENRVTLRRLLERLT